MRSYRYEQEGLDKTTVLREYMGLWKAIEPGLWKRGEPIRSCLLWGQEEKRP